MSKSGFSLVELSIVLVILGLMVGGVMTGRSLIQASQLRAVATEYQQYLMALTAFKDKYTDIPGDMRDATRYWGAVTANGDGDGRPHVDAAVGGFSEMYTFWQHMALAGFISGTYTGRTGPSNNHHSVVGVNTPVSKLGKATFSIDLGGGSGYTDAYNFPVQMFMTYGTTGSILSNEAVLKPEEAWSVDTKMDDGKPGFGIVIAGKWVNCTTSANFTDFNGAYNLSNTSVVCPLIFPKPFGIR